MVNQSSHITKSARETIAFGKKCMEEALKAAKRDTPLIFYLTGELGAGKTHFVKGLAQALGISAITSPTFVLMKKFALSRRRKERLRAGKKYFFHIDCYRISDVKDARHIGLDEILRSPRAIIAIEWAERIADIIARPYWEIKMEHIDDTIRRVIVKNVQR